MEQYVAQFRSMEIQISDDDMKFGDKLEYFLDPFNTTLKRKILLEDPKRMEIAYDFALEYANVWIRTHKKTPEIVDKKLLRSPNNPAALVNVAQKHEVSKDSD